MSRIDQADLIKTIPPAIAENKDIKALGKLIANELQKINKEIPKNIIFSRIDELDETTLDILAYDLNVLWYDYDYNLEIKREIIKDCIKIYRKLGTPYAVKRALGNIFPNTKIKEWFETNDEPYTFSIEINATENGAPADLQAMALDRIRYYKNLRSHLSKITYIMESKANLYAGSAALLGNTLGIYPFTPDDIIQNGTLFIGAAEGLGQEIKVYPYVKREIPYTRVIGFANCLIYRIEVSVNPR